MTRNRQPQPDPLDSDPFYVLGQLSEVINGASIPGVSRSPTQRLAAARSILQRWKQAKDCMKAAGKGFYIGRAP